MKKWLVPVIILGIITFVVYGTVKGFYNQAIKLEEGIEEEWSKVESSYQRRNDLIGNLVKTVQGAADFEKSTLVGVIEARAKATSVTIKAADLTPEKMAEFQEAQAGLTGALSKLLVSVERYPEIKANRNFLELQSQLEGTENRINIARDRFNEKVTPYNNHIRQFPGNIMAGIFNFEKKERFKSEKGAEKAPDINFDFNKK
ncbi:LemA family protein [Tenacibaculum maritimum]|uniref:LemA family protein n=1 Tax=Tenacibaculum maritimum NCIMB 2154 TaxID=1349785 RepID=A0A2H1E6Q7_9FLAO|nr:LemA family protein [Tenacibaculum maritimum]MCD9563181.1 LemA family protein [Tenacibaculum maritimum]MCD9566448.1 LemA family protein [Tenacibaculum maritimum]MCD9579819.1 LemA family protein [Tenacibaculum maritimum]MCD9582022.1 LemA family protein [Tenacibaculum maritimum]MCD9585570.1 LemA family protein [Tenacibaculum maritimum]